MKTNKEKQIKTVDAQGRTLDELLVKSQDFSLGKNKLL